MKGMRESSVYAVWITGEPTHEYAKVRADEGAIGLGRRISVQRTGERLESRPCRGVTGRQRPWFAGVADARPTCGTVTTSVSDPRRDHRPVSVLLSMASKPRGRLRCPRGRHPSVG
jgi:hypothetical protein